MTINFRVAFQGGGANFITLLAASKAVFDLNNDTDTTFNVEMVSGTSAGSIVAGLFSLGIDPELVRRHLQNHGMASYNKIIKIPEKGFLYRGYGQKAVSLVAGHPFFEYSELKNFINELLNIDKVRDNLLLSQVEIPVIFTTSNLSTSEATYWDSTKDEQKEEILSTVIANSCSIPFVFKSLIGAEDSHIVDGGIVENFPLEKLTSGASPSRVIGFSFDQKKNFANKNIISYLNSILSTAINSNVKQSAKQIPEDNVISLPYEFGVLDFKPALEDGLDHLFDKVVGIVKNRLEQIIARERDYEFRQASKSRFSRNFNPEKSANELFETLKNENFTILALEAEWCVNSLRSDMDPLKSETDTLRTTYEIQVPEDQALLVFRIHLSSLTDRIDLTQSEVSVSDEKGNSVIFTPLVGPIKKFASSFNIPVYLFIDLNALSEDAKVIRVQHVDQVATDFPMFMDATSSEAKECEEVGLVCSYPKYQKVTWTVHLPEDIHSRCDFENLVSIDEKVDISGFAQGSIIPNFVGDARTPLNFLTVKWESSAEVQGNQAAGFKIVQNTT